MNRCSYRPIRDFPVLRIIQYKYNNRRSFINIYEWSRKAKHLHTQVVVKI